MSESFPLQKPANEELESLPQNKPESEETLVARHLALSGEIKKVFDAPKFRGAIDATTLKYLFSANPEREIVELLFVWRKEFLSPDAVTNDLVSQIDIQKIGRASLHFLLNSLPEFPNVDRRQFLQDLKNRALAWQGGEKVAGAIESAQVSFSDVVTAEEFGSILAQLRNESLVQKSEQETTQELSGDGVKFLSETKEMIVSLAKTCLVKARENLQIFQLESKIALQGIEDPNVRREIDLLEKQAGEETEKFVNEINRTTSNWFEKKYVNPRTIEGKSETEKLEYARELFADLGKSDVRFSGAAITGSTMKGYGREDSSDIDVTLFYREEYEIGPRESDGSHRTTETFRSDFNAFVEKFNEKRRKAGLATFDIDINSCSNMFDNFTQTLFRKKSKISPDNIVNISKLIYSLSYPVIESNNPNAKMPMPGVLNAIRETIGKLGEEQKSYLSSEVIRKAEIAFAQEYVKYSSRIQNPVSENEYLKHRTNMLKKTLNNKIGLS